MPPRIVLNDGKNLQNVVNKKELHRETKNTLQQLVRQLLQVSGPYSRNAFILYSNSVLNNGSNTDVIGDSNLEIFTRDGIHTLSQIQYISPIQTYIKNQILAFMGRRIDACCSDGTTSSMIFTASFISYLLDSLDQAKMSTLLDVENAYRSVIEKLKLKLNEVKVTKEDLVNDISNDHDRECRSSTKVKLMARTMAFIQALTSSGGNHEIANAIADIFYHTPEQAWKYAIRQRFPYKETPEFKVSARTEDCAASYDCTIMTPELCNIDLGKYYQRDKINILIMRTGMIRSSQCVIALMNYIQHYKDEENKLPLLIMLPTNSNSHDLVVMSELQAGAQLVGLELFITAYERPMRAQVEGLYSVDALSAKANVNAFTENNVANEDYISIEPFLIREASVRCDYHMCYISNVIPTYGLENLDPNLHPAEQYPEMYPFYHFWKDYFLNILEQDIAAGDKGSETTRKDLYRALTIMMCPKCWYIEIGGKTHDQQAIAHILDDAAGAALAAVQHGVYLNGPCKLYTQALGLFKSSTVTPLEKMILSAIVPAARDLVYAIFGEYATTVDLPLEKILKATRGKYDFVDFHQVMTTLEQNDCVPFTYLNSEVKNHYRWESRKLNNDSLGSMIALDHLNPAKRDQYKQKVEDGTLFAPPCQVGNLFDVLFERIREVALRFVFTDSIIAPGTVWSDTTDSATSK